MDTRVLGGVSTTQSNLYENLLNGDNALLTSERVKAKREQSQNSDNITKDNDSFNSDDAQKVIDDINSGKTDITSSSNQRALDTLKSRLQSVENELNKLDQQMKNLSSGNIKVIKATLAGVDSSVSGASGAGVAAGIADISRVAAQENVSENGKTDISKIGVKEAMLRYLSAEKGVKFAELLSLQREIAEAENLNR